MANIEKFFENKKATKKKAVKKELPLPEEPKEKKLFGIFGIKNILFAIGVILFMGSLSASGYFYYRYQKAVKIPEVDTRSETEIISEKIGKFVELPSEKPTLATVTDKDKLKDQSFFTKAQNGDKVLIFSEAGKAIIYRPSNGKIVAMTSLSSSPSVAGAQEENMVQNELSIEEPVPSVESQVDQPMNEIGAEKSEKITVAVYNGARKNGLAASLAEKISSLSGIEIGEIISTDLNYKKTIIIDLSGNNSETVQEIIGIIGGEAGDFPEGEKKPEADILIIGGANN